MTGSQADLAGYDAVRGGAAFYPRPEAGYVRVGGPHRLDFIQRQTTNDARLLTTGRALLTVLTSPTARILDVFTLLAEDDAMGLITQPRRGAPAAGYLRSRIFFMDEVTVEDASAGHAQLDVEGAGAGDLLRRVGLGSIPLIDGATSGDVGGVAVRVIGQDGLAGVGYRLIAPADVGDRVAAALAAAGAERLSAEAHAILRVEAGLPAVGHELTEDYTPLEVGLSRAVSGDKGCYTGQEVIARQITYDKVTQRLVGLRLGAPAPAGSGITGQEGRQVGRVTSVAESPRYGPIALAVVKRPHHEPGTQLLVSGTDGMVEAVTTPLPFSGG